MSAAQTTQGTEDQAQEQPGNAEVLEVVVEMLRDGKSKAEVWQSLVNEGVLAATATGSVAVVERATRMLGRGMSKAEVWQTMVSRGIDASVAEATVSALAQGLPLAGLGLAPCSRCGAPISPSEVTLSSNGEPICADCAERAAAAAQQLRADSASSGMGPSNTTRRCRGCGQPSMRCVQITHVTRGFESSTNYTFTCGRCGHSFTGTEGFGAYIWLMISLGVIVWSVTDIISPSLRSPSRGPLMLLAGAGLFLYSLYNVLIWSLYPEVAPD